MHAPDAATRAARLSPRLEAAQHLVKQSRLPSSLPSSRLLCLPLSGARLCRKAAHACSDCACLPALPDKLRLCTTVVGPLTSDSTASTLLRLRCRCAALLNWCSFEIDYSDAAFKLTPVLAGPRLVAESAHNKTLQLIQCHKQSI